MSSVAIPLPKPAGARPPFGGPPTRTSFDSRPDGSGDPLPQRIEDSVRILLKACRGTDESSAPLFRRLVSQRKRVVQTELDMLRLVDASPLPPLIANLYSLEYLASEAAAEPELERLYVRLLDELDTEDRRLEKLIGDQKTPYPAS